METDTKPVAVPETKRSRGRILFEKMKDYLLPRSESAEAKKQKLLQAYRKQVIDQLKPQRNLVSNDNVVLMAPNFLTLEHPSDSRKSTLVARKLPDFFYKSKEVGLDVVLVEPSLLKGERVLILCVPVVRILSQSELQPGGEMFDVVDWDVTIALVEPVLDQITILQGTHAKTSFPGIEEIKVISASGGGFEFWHGTLLQPTADQLEQLTKIDLNPEQFAYFVKSRAGYYLAKPEQTGDTVSQGGRRSNRRVDRVKEVPVSTN